MMSKKPNQVIFTRYVFLLFISDFYSRGKNEVYLKMAKMKSFVKCIIFTQAVLQTAGIKV
jgi:hypothetical protein